MENGIAGSKRKRKDDLWADFGRANVACGYRGNE